MLCQDMHVTIEIKEIVATHFLGSTLVSDTI